VVIFLLLAVVWLMAGVAHGEECSGARPTDVCEVGPPLVPHAGSPDAVGALKPVPRSPKIHGSIAAAASAIERRGVSAHGAEMEALSTGTVRVDPQGAIQVYVVLGEFRPEHVARLQALGLRLEIALPEFRLVQGWLPAGAVDAVAALDFVRQIKPPGYPVRKGAGAVTTEGDALLAGPAARDQFHVSGAGVKVGVISDGVEHLGDAVASGDLPLGVEVLKAGSGAEGTATLEIVHDVAPGASLAFYGPTTSADMVAGINALAAAGARIAVDDLTFLDEPKFEDGMIAQAARGFATGGRLYVTAAGNSAQRHYRSGYARLTGQNFPASIYPAVHNYGSGGTDIGNSVVVPSGCTLTAILQWNNPFGASADDFDLFLARSDNFQLLAVSLALQTGTQDPYERIDFTNQTDSPIVAFIAVAEYQLASPPGGLILDYFIYPTCGIGLQHVTTADSVIGHEAVEELLSVAALGASTPTEVEPYSSRGPGSVSFPAPASRAVPSIAAIDCVSTQVGQLGFFLMPFCGTSAAAPHVAAIAALLMEWAPALSSEAYRSVLTSTATDLGPGGFDFAYGHGRVDAAAALASAPVPPQMALGMVIEPPAVMASDVVHVNISVANAGGAATQDLYLGILVPPSLSTELGCPDGDAVAFVAEGFASLSVTCLFTAVPQSFVPLVRNAVIPAALPPTAIPDFWTLAWPPGLAEGTYTLVIFTTPPDAFADGQFQASDFTAAASDSFDVMP
jgi:hypothetical protein